MNIIIGLFLFIFLTLISQVGGIVYLISLWIKKKWKTKFKFKTIVVFIPLYLVFTYVIIPYSAPFFGRERIKHATKIQPSNYLTVLLNRNYVQPQLNKLLLNTAKDLNNTGISIHYLDANFPFLNKFPLLPHLSHNDGKKIDLSLIYETKNGEISNKQKSVSGYGHFEKPKTNEHNQTSLCLNKGYFQYDYPKYLTFGTINKELIFSEKGTKKLIKSLLAQPSLGKIFIEPHLKNRLKLNNRKIRFHGCQAVRHDDHIHVQLN